MQKKDRQAKSKPSGEGWFVYIVRCADGSLYTGIAKDVCRRCQQHNAGTASRYTRSRLPVELVYQESLASRSPALKREAAIKALSRRKKLTLIHLKTKTGSSLHRHAGAGVLNHADDLKSRLSSFR